VLDQKYAALTTLCLCVMHDWPVLDQSARRHPRQSGVEVLSHTCGLERWLHACKIAAKRSFTLFFSKKFDDFLLVTLETQVFTVTNAHNTLQHFQGASAPPPCPCLRAPMMACEPFLDGGYILKSLTTLAKRLGPCLQFTSDIKKF